MKLEACINFDDYSTLRIPLKRPTKRLKLKYAVNGKKKQTFPYHFERDKLFLEKRFLWLKKKVIYYKHGNPGPLDATKNAELLDSEELKTIIETDLFAKMTESTKDRKMEMSIGLILGICAIAGIVLIAVLA